jgi:tetratricopeptide (TPR) repeat protein
MIKKHCITLSSILLPLSLFAILFITYIKTLAPTISSGDSGEFITAAVLLGIPHAPGYPLYVLLGHLFSLIPINSIAWRLNLMSAVFQSLAISMTYFIGIKLSRELRFTTKESSALHVLALKFASFCLSLCLGFTYVFWYYGVTADVFALNNVLIVLIILVLLNWRQKTSEKSKDGTTTVSVFRNLSSSLFTVFFLLGLSLSNHQSGLLILPGIIYLIIKTDRSLLSRAKTYASCFLALLLGLLPYIYLPLAASHAPLLNWGNPSTLTNFMRVLLRADYGTFLLSPLQHGKTVTIIQILTSGYNFFKELFDGSSVFILILFLTGLFSFKSKAKTILIFFLLSIAFSTITFITSAGVQAQEPVWGELIKKFYVLPYIFIFCITGAGTLNLVFMLYTENHKVDKLLLTIIRPVSLVLLCLLVFLIYSKQLSKADQSKNTLVYDFGTNILNSLEPHTLFLSYGENNNFPLFYLLWVEKRRPDVILIDQAGLSYTWYVDELKALYPKIKFPFSAADYSQKDPPLNKFILKNMDTYPIYFESMYDHRTIESFTIEPFGLARKILPAKSQLDYSSLFSKNETLFASYAKNGLSLYVHPAYSYEGVLLDHWVRAYQALGDLYYQQDEFDKAEATYKKALEIWPQQADIINSLNITWKAKRDASHEQN